MFRQFNSLWIALFLVFPSHVKAEWQFGSGVYPLQDNQTLAACKSTALQAAKMDAFSKAGRETLSSRTVEICFDTNQVANCELHSQTLNYYDGAYIAKTRNVKVTNTATDCMATLEADVRVYKSQHDPNFILKGQISGSRIKRVGEKFTIVGEVNKQAYLSIFYWSPNVKGDNYTKIFPNKHQGKSLISGTFAVPSHKKDGYVFEALMLPGESRQAINEWLFLLATKTNFELLESESAESFYKRLDELGRENWRLLQIGYTILKN